MVFLVLRKDRFSVAVQGPTLQICLKIYLKICHKVILGQKLRCRKIILRHLRINLKTIGLSVNLGPVVLKHLKSDRKMAINDVARERQGIDNGFRYIVAVCVCVLKMNF